MSYKRSSTLLPNTRTDGGTLTPKTVRKYARDITRRAGMDRSPREALARIFLARVDELAPVAYELDPDS